MRSYWITRPSAALVLLVGLLFGVGSPSVAMAAPGGGTIPPGQGLPDDATCAAQVVPSGELRPSNTAFNQTVGQTKPLPGLLSRLSGNYTGTTDEIIQWAACKWGIDTDVVRAQAAQESSWFMSAIGDFTSDSQWCAPGHVPGGDGRPGCPETVGIMGVKYRYHSVAYPDAAESTAYNFDYALAIWRECFEGQETWLADNPPNSGYRAGDMWGCLGRWYAGDWRSGEAMGYIHRVQAGLRTRSWETAWFQQLTAPTIR